MSGHEIRYTSLTSNACRRHRIFPAQNVDERQLRRLLIVRLRHDP